MIALCRTCRRACYQWTHEHPDWSGGDAVVDLHWSHFVHPADEHDAEPSIVDWESVRDPFVNLAYLTCPYYQGVGSCRNSCYSEPTCVTGGPWDIPPGWTPERLASVAKQREQHERRPA